MDEFEINIKDRNRRRRLHATMHKNSVTGSDMERHRTYTPAYERVADTVSEANNDMTTPEEDMPAMDKPRRKSHEKRQRKKP